jgi:hypothetical protein
MNKTITRLAAAVVLTAVAGPALACDYQAGETRFVDYANCRYGKDSILVVDLPQDSSWENCVYFVEAFRPEKLLAVTRMNGDKEVLSINERGQIGNPCYLSKQRCDAALKAHKQAQR